MKKAYLIILILSRFITAANAQNSAPDTSAKTNKIDWEVFPIVSYDTDTGFGYGIKGYIRNIFKGNESYDLILYNSTRGERWYRFQFSWPDDEARQGTEFGYALDFIVDYDKWINYYFYGIGNLSSYDNREIYTKEPFELNIMLSKTFTANIILKTGFKYSTIKYTDFPDSSLPAEYMFENKENKLEFLIDAVYDTRNSIMNPDAGMALTAGLEISPKFSFSHNSFSKALLTFQSYRKIIFPDLILAGRISIQQLIGNNIPMQFLIPLGGNETLRGYRQDRFLDKSSTLINAELRYPIWKRFGGIAGVDAGRVFPSLNKFSFNNWRINPVAGLRYYMNNFVVRADIGISNETIGFYLNFGHIF